MFRLSATWLRQIFFTLTEHGAVRVLDALTTLVLIRVMSASDFGLFSVYQSWVAMLLIFFPSIEVALFREYGRLKREGSLASELAAYRLFNYMKLGALFVFIAVFSLVHQPAPWIVRVALLAFAFALPFSQAFYSFMREPLRFELKQGLVAFFSILQRVGLVGALLVISYVAPGQLPLLVAGALFVYILTGLGWSFSSRELFAKHASSLRGSLKALSATFWSIVIWVHLNGVITQTVQTFDVFSLNLFGTDLSETGRYGIALKAANFFQILPVALASSIGVYLARNQGDRSPKDELRRVKQATLLFIVLCSSLWITGYFFGKPLLAFLAKGKLDEASLVRTFEYFKWQLAGILILCVSHPLSTYLSIRASLTSLFWKVAVPWLILAMGGYLAGSYWQGPLGAAKANVFAYASVVLMLIFYYFFHHDPYRKAQA